jgi:hypothetical protein
MTYNKKIKKMNVLDVKIYIISPGTGKYKNRLESSMKTLSTLGFKDIEHIKSIEDTYSNIDSLSKTFSFILDNEMDMKKPFIIVEDDINVLNFTKFLNTPEDAHCIYLGSCVWVYPYPYKTINTGYNIRLIEPLDSEDYDEEYVRIKGMTSAHAILFLDKNFVKEIKTRIDQNILGHTAHDIVLASSQLEYRVYALKNPIFYQDINLDGQECNVPSDSIVHGSSIIHSDHQTNKI